MRKMSELRIDLPKLNCIAYNENKFPRIPLLLKPYAGLEHEDILQKKVDELEAMVSIDK